MRLSEKRGEPDDADLHYHLGLAYQKANQTALARQQLEKAVKLSPNNDDARKALSELPKLAFASLTDCTIEMKIERRSKEDQKGKPRLAAGFSFC